MSNSTDRPTTIALAGSTERTLLLAQALQASDQFQIDWIITPPPRPRPQDKQPTPNPLHSWAIDNQLPSLVVNKTVDTIRPQLTSLTATADNQPDLLLVADFGYIIPSWLLKLPKIAPLNFHPSRLPAWRGSSPGQFVLLSGAKSSALTLIEMSKRMDAGPIIWQQNFRVEENWTHADYYAQAYQKMAEQLGSVLDQFVTGQLQTQLQPTDSPTPIAILLKRQDGFVAWQAVAQLMTDASADQAGLIDEWPHLFVSLVEYFPQPHPLAKYIVRAARALQPWPGLWTELATKKGKKRMKILAASIVDRPPSDPANPTTTSLPRLQLDQVQIEGQRAATWNQVKNLVK